MEHKAQPTVYLSSYFKRLHDHHSYCSLVAGSFHHRFMSTPVCVCVCVREGEGERDMANIGHKEGVGEWVREMSGLGWVGLGRSVQQHLIVNKRGVSSHADQVTAGNKRAIWIRWLSPYLRDQSPVTPSFQPPPNPPPPRALVIVCCAVKGHTHTRTHAHKWNDMSLLAGCKGRQSGWMRFHCLTLEEERRQEERKERRREERREKERPPGG